MPHTVVSSPTSWTVGNWTSPLLEVSLKFNADPSNNTWTELKWIEQETEDESNAYVRIDILDSSDNNLQTDLAGTAVGIYKSIDLSALSNVVSADIKIKFKLYGKNRSPIVSKIQIR